MLRRRIIGIAIAGACLAMAAASVADLSAPNTRKAVPNFTLSDANGAQVNLSNYRGRVVLLDFWATWCDGCKTEIPWYMEYQRKYGAKGLSVVGVAMEDQGWQIVKPFLINIKVNYPVVVGNWDLAKGFGIKALPVTLLIDRDGKVADFHDSGLVDRNAFAKEIRTLLKAKSR